MPNEPQIRPPSAPTTTTFTGEVSRLLPGLFLTVVVAFASSWWSGQVMQNNLQNRIERSEERQEALAARVSENAATTQQNTIRLERITERNDSMMEQIREMKQNQERLLGIRSGR